MKVLKDYNKAFYTFNVNRTCLSAPLLKCVVVTRMLLFH